MMPLKLRCGPGRRMMKKSLHNKIEQLIERESQAEVNEDLLNMLRALATEDTDYDAFDAPTRNALNQFFREVKALLLAELLENRFGADVILNAAIILAFEVGYKFKRDEM